MVTTCPSRPRQLHCWHRLVRTVSICKAPHCRQLCSRQISMVRVLVCRQRTVISLLHRQLSPTLSWCRRRRLRSCQQPSNRLRSICTVSLDLINYLFVYYIFTAWCAHTINCRAIAMMFVCLGVTVWCILARIWVYGWIVQCSGHPDTKACPPRQLFPVPHGRDVLYGRAN